MKVGLKKLLIWALVVSSLLGVVAGSQVTAIKTSDALEKMKEAGKIQLVTNVMSKCVKQRVDKPYNPDKGGISENYVPYAPTTDTFADLTTSIPSGSWLENQIQGKVNNGTVDCQDNDSNIINVFASTLGVDKNAVFCDGKKPGILKLQNQDSSGKWVDVSGECAAGIGNNNLRFVFNDEGANAHIKKLYNAQKGKNQYLVSWGDRGTFSDDLINYFLYFNDFTTSCSSGSPYSGDESLLNKSKYFGPIKVPNPSTGKMEERYYSNTSVVKNSWGSNWVDKKGAHTCDAVIKRINETAPAVQKALNATEKDEDGTKPDDIVGDITNDAAGNVEGDSANDIPCLKAGQSLGWIICPVVELVGNAVHGIYGYIENNFLQVNPQYISDNGTKNAWGSFRDLANIIFAIALLIIILSQITGFGVSNYGIKKMLPSLVIVAVLVNVSFFLCEFAVDLSNIVGYGAGQLFNGIDTGVNEGSYSLGGMVNGTVTTFLTGTGTVGALFIAYESIEFWIMPFLLMLLIAFISVVFFFILLGVRQAGIIILVTLAPVAIICYALPNTKIIFSRWRKIFFSLLLVYPICGLLMSGGQFASRLLLTVGMNPNNDNSMGFAYAFVAVLLQAVPFFFVPSILKSSMAAMGNLGAKLSTFGNRLSGGASRAIRNSEAYRDSRARLAGHNAERQLERMQNNKGIGNRINNKLRQGNGRFSAMAKNSYNRKRNRLQGVALAQNLSNRDRSDYYEQRHIDEIAGDYASTWDKDGTFASEQKTAAELEGALDALRVDSTNTDARARFTAAMRNLNTSDKGREYVDSTLNKAVLSEARAGHTGNEGIKWASNAVRKAAGGEYKAKTPNAFANMMDYAAGEEDAYNAAQFSTITRRDRDGNTETLYVRNRQAKAGDIGAEQLAGTDDSFRRDMITGLTDGSITGNKRNNIISQAREAINNENINVKGDVGRDLNKIANMEYAAPVGSTSNNSSVNTVDGASIRSMANASQTELNRISASISSGITSTDERAQLANVAEATLNAANAGTVTLSQETANGLNRIRALDGRTEIPYSLRVQHGSGNTAPVPDGFTENGSGIIIPRNNGSSGDMTGSQIRDFERQMRQRNNN